MVFHRFRWVFCQLEMLQNCLPQNIRRVLRELPKTLDATYERVLKEIGMTNQYQAYRLLQCLTVAIRPLRVEELAEVLALDFDGAKDGIPALNKAWRWDDQQEAVLSTCSSLIIISHDHLSNSRVVQFAHFSVKEYLVSRRLANVKADISHFHIRLETAHTIIAQACLAILLQSNYNISAKNGSPLSNYAAQYWVDHAQFKSVFSRVKNGVQRLFDPSKPYLAAWLDIHDIDNEWSSFVYGQFCNTVTFSSPQSSKQRIKASQPHGSVTPNYAPLCLYYSSFCGFSDPAESLLAEHPEYLNVRIGLNRSPLVAALYKRRFQVAELLHRNGAAVDVTVHRNHTPLHAASISGNADVARWLLEHGADGKAQQGDHLTPLHFAAANGHLEIVRTLLRHSVDVNAMARDNRTPLHEASDRGQIDIVQLLIQHGADVNAQDRSRSTPLHLASSWGGAGSVQLLVEHGADVNAQDEKNKTPLHTALTFCTFSADTVQLLIKHGANVNACDGNHRTPLHWISYLWKPHADAARMLLEHGATVDVVDDLCRTPLQIAMSRGHQEIVDLLIYHLTSVE
jgi:ankyrin repeat protein